jgi:ATP-binding cassette subfamily B protein
MRSRLPAAALLLPARTGRGLVALARVLRFIMRVSPRLTLGLVFANVLMGLTPTASAFASKLLVDTVVRAIDVHAHGSPDQIALGLTVLSARLRLPVMSTMSAIVLLAVGQLGLVAAGALLGAVRGISQQLLQEKTSLHIQMLVMERSAALDLAFFEDSASYDLLRQAQQEAASRPIMMVTATFGIVQSAMTFASVVLLLLAISPVLALIALVAPLPAFAADTVYGWRGYGLMRWASPIRRRMQYLGMLVTTDTYAKEIRQLGLAGHVLHRFRELSRTYYERQRGQVAGRQLAALLFGSTTMLTTAGTSLFVAVQVVAARLTLGDLTLYTQAAQAVQSSIQGILSGFTGIYEHSLYLSNLHKLLDTPATVVAPARPRALPARPRGEIQFEQVTFRYPGTATNALEAVSFVLRAGETAALVGRNGAGKSTLVKLVCRFYDPQEGRILVDGIDVRELEPDRLRAIIGAVYQDYVTYQETAADNIGVGDVTRLGDLAAIEGAAARGGADQLIRRLPHGYQTQLGRWFEGGLNLSGGELQKIALSRTFMRDARILILDEPTAAADAQAEQELLERLRELSRGRTAIIVSHRFSMVRHADRILVLDQGRLIEDGGHEELVALEGVYATLFGLQAAAYTSTSAPAAPVLR